MKKIALLILIPFIGVSGCSTAPEMDYGQIELCNVGGTITLDGKPLPDAVVTFEADATFSYAMTDSDGEYTLQFDTVKRGVTPGKKIVRVSTTRRITGLNLEEEGASEETDEPRSKAVQTSDLVPKCYNEESRLTLDVTESATFDFDLKSDCSVTGPV